jgi:hypothetical protein
MSITASFDWFHFSRCGSAESAGVAVQVEPNCATLVA